MAYVTKTIKTTVNLRQFADDNWLLTNRSGDFYAFHKGIFCKCDADGELLTGDQETLDLTDAVDTGWEFVSETNLKKD